MAKSININHSNSSIISSDGTYVELSKNGVVKIGTGINAMDDSNNTNTEDVLKEYEGALKFNPDTKKLEYCDGTRWIELSLDSNDNKTSMIYSMLF